MHNLLGNVDLEDIFFFDIPVDRKKPIKRREISYLHRSMVLEHFHISLIRVLQLPLYRVPTQIGFPNCLSFPCPSANFPCANLRDL